MEKQFSTTQNTGRHSWQNAINRGYQSSRKGAVEERGLLFKLSHQTFDEYTPGGHPFERATGGDPIL